MRRGSPSERCSPASLRDEDDSPDGLTALEERVRRCCLGDREGPADDPLERSGADALDALADDRAHARGCDLGPEDRAGDRLVLGPEARQVDQLALAARLT